MSVSALRCLLEALAWSALRRVVRAREAAAPLRVIAGDDQLRLTLILEPAGDVSTPEPASSPAAPEVGELVNWLSPLEQGIVRALLGGRPLSGKDLGSRTHHLDTRGHTDAVLRITLDNLGARGLLEHDEGYALTAAGQELAGRFGLTAEGAGSPPAPSG